MPRITKRLGKNKKPPKEKKPPRGIPKNSKENLEKKVIDIINKLKGKRKTEILPLFWSNKNISPQSVDEIYDVLRKEFKGCKKLDVIVDSGGGDIHSAYHLAKTFRYFAHERLTFIVPRWAKSAATLMVLGGDEIIFGPTSELGPLDPRITRIEKGIPQEEYSPLAIRTALDLIAEEGRKKNLELVRELSEKLPPTITLGQHVKTLEIAKHYVVKLLTTRMLKNHPEAQKIATSIGDKLTSAYPHHGYCIDYEEALELGITAKLANEGEWKLVWELHNLIKQREREEEKEKIKRILKEKGLTEQEVEKELSEKA